MLYLSRNKNLRTLCLILFLTIGSTIVYGQRDGIGLHFKKFNTKPYYFGLTIGINSSNYKVKHSEAFILNDSILVAEGVNGPGFQVGLIGNLKFGKYFDFRILPGFSFTERRINYLGTDTTRPIASESIEGIQLEFPVQLRFKSQPYRNKRFYVITGLKFTYDFGNNSQTRQAESLLQVTPYDFQVEVGAGIQLFFPFFIFSPELKFSHGVNNILIENRNRERSNVLDKLFTRSLTLSFHFEG